MDRLLEPQNDLIKDDAMTFDGNTRLDIGAKYEKDFRRTVPHCR